MAVEKRSNDKGMARHYGHQWSVLDAKNAKKVMVLNRRRRTGVEMPYFF